MENRYTPKESEKGKQEGKRQGEVQTFKKFQRRMRGKENIELRECETVEVQEVSEK